MESNPVIQYSKYLKLLQPSSANQPEALAEAEHVICDKINSVLVQSLIMNQLFLGTQQRNFVFYLKLNLKQFTSTISIYNLSNVR